MVIWTIILIVFGRVSHQTIMLRRRTNLPLLSVSYFHRASNEIKCLWMEKEVTEWDENIALRTEEVNVYITSGTLRMRHVKEQHVRKRWDLNITQWRWKKKRADNKPYSSKSTAGTIEAGAMNLRVNREIKPRNGETIEVEKFLCSLRQGVTHLGWNRHTTPLLQRLLDRLSLQLSMSAMGKYQLLFPKKVSFGDSRKCLCVLLVTQV